MSASPMTRSSTSTDAIPIKKVLVNDLSELPHHYSQTPGGTLFSTTPGGTKIVYERNFLLNLRNSPISRTPPHCTIPENLIKGAGSPPKKSYNHNRKQLPRNRKDSQDSRRGSSQDDVQFQLEL